MAVVPLSACGGQRTEPSQIQSGQPRADEPRTPQEPEESLPQTGTPVEEPQPEEPAVQTVSYFSVVSDGVNIRSGAGTGYPVRGQAEKYSTYALTECADGWYKTGYRNRSGYISQKYCTVVELPSSGNEGVEAVIAEGAKLLGTPYVYGAVRLHDGRGNFYGAFDINAFDCSSLMQYIFYKGAGVLLNVNTRTQVYQGAAVAKEDIERGDLLFFTNDSRRNNKGVERIGHVALYLGGNYILHTASDYARIEQISPKRWSYFIEARRIAA